MSDKILRALMQLFAIVANAESLTLRGRSVVETFLRQQLSQSLIQTYLAIFDDYLNQLQGKTDENKQKKRVSVNSVKVLRICTEINLELDQKQKYIVLIRLIEFAYTSSDKVNEQELEFLSTVANVFNISNQEFDSCVLLAAGKKAADVRDDIQFLFITNSEYTKPQFAKHLINETLEGELCILHFKQAGMMFARYFGNNQLTINGHPILSDTVIVFSPGSVIRGAKAQPVYYSDALRCFLENKLQTEINLSIENVEYVFSNGKKGLNCINFSASSGSLIGIMGGSGAGKSTLLNILNSNLTPANGEVRINGINIHSHKKKIEGVIGFVPQDDLLMEDLSVFQNLFYNSKLCFGNLNDEQIIKKVNSLMESLGLFEIKDLKVGDVLNKTISGGQRKRLNIALELIRTPSVLFVDEPTSGLSSLDSENVMDLLKQLSISGKLVFVVIHQPSSDIFKLFDKLMILDIGGYPIYFGNPVDSLIYFKNKASYADAHESECETCGNINPEQVFSIIESKVIDEFGNPTQLRKFSPAEWNAFYHAPENKFNQGYTSTQESGEVKSDFKKPSRLQQLSVFIKRDVLSKLRNTQYLLINFLEAPVLAFILAYILKYSKEGSDYIFSENINLPAYIFMCVIVALFMGLTVSAEEIIRDRKILKREKFLNLSRSSYLLSKIMVQFFISAVQTFSFVMVGNFVFGIKDMYVDYWLVLFSVSCFSNLLGLAISASFDSVVTIYILIPFLIIPQIILSGLIAKFENLNPQITSQETVPLIGELMASRWAFEALAVNQFKNNKYESLFFDVDKQLSESTYKKAIWLQVMKDKLDSIHAKQYALKTASQISLFKNELKKENYSNNSVDAGLLEAMPVNEINDGLYEKLKPALEKIRKQHITKENNARSKKDNLVQIANHKNPTLLATLQNTYTNKTLSDWVKNKGDKPANFIIECDEELIQRYEPVYTKSPLNTFIRAQYFVSQKNVLGNYFETYGVNIFVIWAMSLLLALALYFNILRKILHSISNLF